MANATSGAERPWEHIPDAFGSVEDISDALIAREQDAFIVGDYSGNITPGNQRGLGLYYRDARHVSAFALQLDGAWPNVLLTTSDSGHSWEQVLGNHHFEQGGRVVGRCTVELHRRLVLDADGFEERLSVTNFNPFPVTVRPSYLLAADFADIFEVRGHGRRTAGLHQKPELGTSSVCYCYRGADGVERRTQVTFDTQPALLDEHGALFELTLAGHETRELHTTVSVWQGQTGRAPVKRTEWTAHCAAIETSDKTFNAILQRALADLRMLWTRDDAGRSYIAAGTPWFATLFGRDSIITALQVLPFMPSVARDCLTLLAAYQADTLDAFSAQEPGKILHELRQGELSAIGELPYRRYYGSVDATPLFLLLASEYWRWSGDDDFMRALLPALNAALAWLEHYGDVDGDGFIEYRTDAKGGLRNQGWKDSEDSVMHAEGKLCSGPIALVEVQGYVYAAYQGMARVFEGLDDTKAAQRLREKARRLRDAFAKSFWLPDEGYVALALDGENRPARVMSSNAGQVLWSGILDQDKAAAVCTRLMQPDMFSGWGVRTLAAGSARYNPLGYHVGTVWPHDNAVIAAGLKRYGEDQAALSVFDGLYCAASTWPDLRLPELFGGHARGLYSRPVPYPVACRPQAWTAGAWFMLLAATLGMVPDAVAGRVTFIAPRLPAWLSEIRLQGLRVGDRHFDATLASDPRTGAMTVQSGAGAVSA